MSTLLSKALKYYPYFVNIMLIYGMQNNNTQIKDMGKEIKSLLKQYGITSNAYIEHDILQLVDPDELDHFIDMLAEYKRVLNDKQFKAIDVINATKFCYEMEISQGDPFVSFINTFKKNKDVIAYNKCNNPHDRSKLKQKINRQVAIYRRSAAVRKILEESEMPFALMFQGYKHRAIEVLQKTMHEASMDKDRIAAADALLKHLSTMNLPQNNININVGQSNVVSKYKDELEEYALAAQKALNKGLEAKQIINIKAKDSEQN